MNPANLIEESSIDFSHYRMPAEWEPHTATWLAWPKNEETWPGHLADAQKAWVQMAEALCPHETVYLIVDSCETDEEIEQHLSSIASGRDHIKPVRIPYDDSWMRDAGPLFIKARQSSSSPPPLIAQDFIFNSWGQKYGPWEADDLIPIHASNLLRVPLLRHNFVLEGGSIDTNGSGTLLTTRQCLLNKNRNPHFSQTQIEQKLRRYLGVEAIIWLGDGIEGDDTDGHIDDLSRFVNETTIVTVVEHNASDPNYQPLKENVEALSHATDAQGRTFQIVELPMPNRVEGPFGRCPASYANFYIANHTVLVPTYRCEQDDIALSILQTQFPDRKVIGIDCTHVVAGLGAIHCVTQQQPA